MERIAASRAVVDRLVHGEALIYGLNTGLGHMRNERVPLEMLRAYQQAVVVSHAGAIGDPLPTEVVRATMAARLAGFAVGGSGVSPAVADALAALLNARVHPIVPEAGSVGAADLMHLAAVAEVLIGMGWAELDGERLPGAEALRRAGLAPVGARAEGRARDHLRERGRRSAHGALVTLRAERARGHRGPRPGALSRGDRREPVDRGPRRPRREAGRRPDRVAAATSPRMLAGSTRAAAGAAGVSVQDPLSFRVGPQVHGGFRENGRPSFGITSRSSSTRATTTRTSRSTKAGRSATATSTRSRWRSPWTRCDRPPRTSGS